MSAGITTERLRLSPASVDELNALIAEDKYGFERLLGASAPDPIEPPPETGDVLVWFRDTLADDPAIAPWFFRWIVDRVEGRLVGSAGFSGYPDTGGTLLMGYSVYPWAEGNGYASEAAAALVRWALAQPPVQAVRATIPPRHVASQRVAANAGLTYRFDMTTEDDGTVQVWEIDRQPT